MYLADWLVWLAGWLRRTMGLPLIAQRVGCDLEELVHVIIHADGEQTRQNGTTLQYQSLTPK